MPWETPTLRDVRSLVRDNIRGSLPGADALVPNSVLRVLSDAQGGLCHLTLQYIDWLALQLLPDTAEQEWLDRHGDIWLKNADGTIGRKVATLAEGTAEFTTTIDGIVIPIGSRLAYQQTEYETTATIITSIAAAVEGPIRSLDPGSAGNLLPGTALSMISGPEGIDSITVVDLRNGTDEENDDDLRYRVLQRIQQPPMGGSKHDYVQWALAVPGVTRAWCGPLEMGIGTVTVRFMMDELRADDNGWPTFIDVETVRDYIDTVRPVAVKDYFVEAPIKQRIDFFIAGLVPNTEEVRAEIEASIKSMLREKASPGLTIFASWKGYAVMNAAGVESFRLTNNLDDTMESPGHMAVLGDIVYGL